jgi:SAM-dependent methyltransferase
MKSAWQADFNARAAAYWTHARTRQHFGAKELPLMPANAGPLLRALGLVHADASMPSDAQRKFMQINHMLVLLEDPLRDLIALSPTVRLLDAGCGSSYLTYLLAWVFLHRFQHPVQILGVDRNPDVIAKCRARTQMIDLDGVLRFEVSDIAEVDVDALWPCAFGVSAGERLDGLISLHACDTASDDALALALRTQAELIAVAPCCQAELARKWAALPSTGAQGAFAPLWASPHLRRQAGSTLTDAMRTLLLRGAGYHVTAMEFVPSAHTPKNTLLRARRGQAHEPVAFAEYVALKTATGGVGIALEQRLPAEARAALRDIEARIGAGGDRRQP